MRFTFDTETARFRPGVMAPELACVSYVVAGQYPQLVHVNNSRDVICTWLRDADLIVAHHAPYDLAVICAHWPDLIPAVFAALSADRITDTKIREQLIMLGFGRFKGHRDKSGKWTKTQYSLDMLARRYLGHQIDKKDPEIEAIRLGFGPLRHLPLDQWPPKAVAYAKEDADLTDRIFQLQEKAPPEFLVNQYAQTRYAFWLHLAKTWGLRTRTEGVTALTQEVERRKEDVKKELMGHGLVRDDGSRDTKEAAALMIKVCTEAQKEVRRNDPTEKMLRDGQTQGSVQLDEDACRYSEDDTMLLYAEYTVLGSILSKDVPALAAGVEFPIHTDFGLAESGRTTSASPNVQNFRRSSDEEGSLTAGLQGIRECFVPRAGHVYFQADYPSLELRTLAQACMSLVGHSELAKVLNADVDPHTSLAAEILGIPYDECKARLKAEKDLPKGSQKPCDNARQTAKVANFGFPGGLGYKSLISFARKSYKVILSEDQARDLKRRWLARWPEMREYFDFVARLTDEDRPVVQLFSNRIRRGCTYTSACNTYFQGLGADCSKLAGWEVSKRCYLEHLKSPLFGSRIVNFVHDEIIGECLDNDQAHDVATELAKVMKDAANRLLPDVPFIDVEPALMAYWSKNAKTIRDENGRLKVWGRDK